MALLRLFCEIASANPLCMVVWKFIAHPPTGTIPCMAVNEKGDISATTTTSGLAWKIPGRVGDSPILGAGLYVDGEVGAAGSTGRGEANLLTLASFQIVESMRQGMHPKDAGIKVYEEIARRWPNLPVLFSTGHGDENLLTNSPTGKKIGYLQKPYESDALLAALDELLR